jgi:hypothetical protein
MMTKLFSMYPLSSHANTKASMAAYIEETQIIHPLILSHALRRLTGKVDRRWLPTVAEIRAESARLIRAAQPRSQNAFALGYNPWAEEPQLDVEKWLKPVHQLWALPEGSSKVLELVDRATERIKAKGK